MKRRLGLVAAAVVATSVLSMTPGLASHTLVRCERYGKHQYTTGSGGFQLFVHVGVYEYYCVSGEKIVHRSTFHTGPQS